MFNSPASIIKGCGLHPEGTWVFTNILSFPLPHHLKGFIIHETLDQLRRVEVQCQHLRLWELVISMDVRRKMRSALCRGNMHYTLTLPLFESLLPAMLMHCTHMTMSATLLYFLYALIPQINTHPLPSGLSTAPSEACNRNTHILGPEPITYLLWRTSIYLHPPCLNLALHIWPIHVSPSLPP